MKTTKLFASLLALLMPMLAWAAEAELPEQLPGAPLVADFAGVLATASEMNDSLIAYEKAHQGTQVLVVTTNDLLGYTPAEYAAALGDKWGIGQKDADNGVIILVKPKTPDSKGEFFIAPGRGLEGVLPDVTCRQITSKLMVPVMKQDSTAYDKATWAAVDAVCTIAAGGEVEFNQAGDEEPTTGEKIGYGLLFVSIVGGTIGLSKYLERRGYGGGGGGGGTGSSGSSYSSSSRGGSSRSSSSRSSRSYGGGSFSGGGGGSSW